MSPASQSFRFRESRRLLREVPVRLSVPGEDGELVARTRDIAIGGMFVATSDVRPVGTDTAFVLELGSADAPDTVQGEAAVVWVREAPGGADQPAGMGMQFTRVEPPGEERLAMLFSEPPDEAAGSDAAPEAPSAGASRGGRDRRGRGGGRGRGRSRGRRSRGRGGRDGGRDTGRGRCRDGRAGGDQGRGRCRAGGAGRSRGAAHEPPSEEAAPPEEPATGDGEVGDTRADLFGDLAGDQDDWMSRESDRPSWVWPTVAGVILVGLLADLPAWAADAARGHRAETAPKSSRLPWRRVSRCRRQLRNHRLRNQSRPWIRPRRTGLRPSLHRTRLPPKFPIGRRRPRPPSRQPHLPSRLLHLRSRRHRLPSRLPGRALRRLRSRVRRRAHHPPTRPRFAAITASVQDGRTLVEIAGNAPFERHHVMLLEAPPRLLVRLIGVQRAYDASTVSAPRLLGVRTGVHGRGATRNLHVVLDLAAPDIVATVERRGDRVVVHLSD